MRAARGTASDRAEPVVENPRAVAAPAPDATPEQVAEARYVEVLNGLLDDAAGRGQMHTLADSLAWTLAQIIAQYGTAAAGDVLRRLGGYVGVLNERRSAMEEAAKAKAEGHLPN